MIIKFSNIRFFKIKDLKELKETLKNPLSQEGIKELEELFENIGYGSNLKQVKTNFTIVREDLLIIQILLLKQI